MRFGGVEFFADVLHGLVVDGVGLAVQFYVLQFASRAWVISHRSTALNPTMIIL